MPSRQVLDALRVGMVDRLVPLMRDTLDAALHELEEMVNANPPTPALLADRAAIAMARHDVKLHERSWQGRIEASLQGWPMQTPSHRFALMEDHELRAQLAGASVMDALDRNFDSVIDLIERRLATLAAHMGNRDRPGNPFSPRGLAEGFAASISMEDANPRLQTFILRHFSRLAIERLGAFYKWCNSTLADAGYELSAGSDGLLIAGLSTSVDSRAQGGGSSAPGGGNGTDVLRKRLLQRPAAVAGNAVRELRPEEMLAVLSLLQIEREAPAGLSRECSTAEALRMRIEQACVSIGIGSVSAVRSPWQDASIEVVGRLFDQLKAGVAASPTAQSKLERLVVPTLRLALETPDFFDASVRHPMLRLLSLLLRLWDGNPQLTAFEQAQHRLADEAADEVLDDPDASRLLLQRVLERLEQEVDASERKAGIATRRLVQSIQGKERLEVARREADGRLARLFASPLPEALAAFLSEHWRLWLAQLWLREGSDSIRVTRAMALGERLLAITADGDSRSVARSLLEVEPMLRECLAASGLEGEGADSVLSGLIAEYAVPGQPLALRSFEPLASGSGQEGSDPVHLYGVAVDDLLLRRLDDGAMRALGLAWVSPLTGACLLVNGQGMQDALLASAIVRGELADGRMIRRSGGDPVRRVLDRLEAAVGLASS